MLKIKQNTTKQNMIKEEASRKTEKKIELNENKHTTSKFVGCNNKAER